MIKYKKGSLFDAPKETILVHACNSKGVWGSGIAAEFKKRYPAEFLRYERLCKYGENILGTGPIYSNVGCLITSSGFGNSLDTKDEILVHTTLALNNLCERGPGPIASNKFNSGLFKVPWEETEKILNVFVKKYNLDWTVYEP